MDLFTLHSYAKYSEPFHLNFSSEMWYSLFEMAQILITQNLEVCEK